MLMHKLLIKNILALLFLLFACNFGGADRAAYPCHIRQMEYNPVNHNLENYLSDFEYSRYIDARANRFLQRWEMKGMSMAVVKEGKLVYVKGYGLADEENSIPVSPENLFRVASVSKLITAVAVMKLVEEGYLKLDSKVFGGEGILNKYEGLSDSRMKQVTVKHLLNHTAGWTKRYGDPLFTPLLIAKKTGNTSPPDIESYLEYVTSRRLHFKPGSRSKYSNLGYLVLQRVIEEVSGQGYEDYVKYHILYPVGIYDMHLGKSLKENLRKNEVRYYEQDDAEKVYSSFGTGDLVPKSYGGNNIELLGAAGGWIASAAEIAKLVVAIDGFDTYPDILEQSSIDKMTNDKEGMGALGWKTATPQGIWIRTGTLAGTSAMIKRLPDGTVWAVLINTSNYKGPKFPHEINKLMNGIMARVSYWPGHNLFEYTKPVDVLAMN